MESTSSSSSSSSVRKQKHQLSKELAKEKYAIQTELWPKEGRHILAQYDEESVMISNHL